MLLPLLIFIFTSANFPVNSQFDTFDSGAMSGIAIGGVPLGYMRFSNSGRQRSSAYAISIGDAGVKFYKRTGWIPPAILREPEPPKEIVPVKTAYTRSPIVPVRDYTVIKTTNYVEDYKPSTVVPPVKSKPCRVSPRPPKRKTKAPYYPPRTSYTEASTKAPYYEPSTKAAPYYEASTKAPYYEASTKAPYYLPLKVYTEAPYSAPAVEPEKIIVDDLYYQPSYEQPIPPAYPLADPYPITDAPYFPPDPLPGRAVYPPVTSAPAGRPPRPPIRFQTEPPTRMPPTRRFPNRRSTISPPLEPIRNFPGFFEIPETR